MTTHDTTHETAEALDHLLRGEISAIETYAQAIDKFQGHPEQSTLRRLRADHVDSANVLRAHVATRGEENSTSSGAWGAFARAVEVTAQLLGHTSALQALREGETHGRDAYENLLMRTDIDPSARELVSVTLLPRQKAHIASIDRLIDRHVKAKAS
jgi:hypothetical protein